MADVANDAAKDARPAAKPAIDEEELLRSDLTRLITATALGARFLARGFTRVRVEGAIDAIPREGPVILASNHISNADAVVIGAWLTPTLGRRMHWLGKREMFDWPVVGWMARNGGIVPVDRAAADADAFRLAQRILQAGEVLMIFPEGTRSPTGELQRPKDGLAMTSLLAHYAAAENAAAYIADPRQGSADSARSEVMRSSTAPTSDHAYTQFVAYEYYDKNNQKPLSEAALQRAANGPEASWEVYSRLIDIYLARKDYPGAQRLMDQAVTRFEDSPVLMPKRIQILAGQGDFGGASALLPKCKSYDIKELYDACKKAANAG